MINCQIIEYMSGRCSMAYKMTGFGKTLPDFEFAMNLSGWTIGENCIDVAYEVETIDWPEGDQRYPADMKTLFVLGSILHMN